MYQFEITIHKKDGQHVIDQFDTIPSLLLNKKGGTHYVK